MKNSVRIVAVLCLFLLAGCGASKYAPLSGLFAKDGYGDSPIDVDTYRVMFVGNALTSAEIVDRYALYRAAELTQQKGFDYFVVIDEGMAGSTNVAGNSDAKVSSSTTHEAFKTIKVYKGTKPEGGSNAYNAKSLLSVMGPTIEK